MPLVLYDTKAQRKETFRPLKAGRVGMYVCGPTVYGPPHIGNARPVVVFDLLYRLLKKLYPRVTYVRNITDVDDKINAAAKERGIGIRALTEQTIRQFHEDMAALGALPPDVEPRATEHIPQMVALIERLLAGGHAYLADGHVLFDVPSDPEYGKLSHREREEMISGARVEVAPYKRHPADFVLWKPSGPDLPGWESPWGRGRPGWHVECSAMSQHYLGPTIDIHGGGSDLIFPHHENEIAQSECAYGMPFARYWVHNGILTVDGEKMAKSLGNVILVRDALAAAPGEAVRLFLISAHYRHPLDWTRSGLAQAKAAADRLYRALAEARDVKVPDAVDVPQAVMAPLEDDLNTPRALAELHRMAGELNKARRPAEREALKAGLLAAGRLIGILAHDPGAWLQGPLPGDLSEGEIERLIAERAAARARRDFAEADRIRARLAEHGVVLEDRREGTIWRRAS